MVTVTRFKNIYFQEIFLQAYQSNNLEYTILAKASRLSAAASGSSHFVIVSSLVTITRLQRESSSAFTSHLNKNWVKVKRWKCKTLKQCKCTMLSHMKSSAAVSRWNQDFSSLGKDESTSFPFLNSMFPRCKIAATTLKIAS